MYFNLGIVLVLLVLLSSCRTIIRDRRHVKIPPHTIIFTFDDGPNDRADVTHHLLDILKHEGITAFFCVVGKHVQAHPSIVRRIKAEGHFLVNHFHNHDISVLGSEEVILKEITACDKAIGEALGENNYRSSIVRPPLGLITPSVEAAIRKYGAQLLPVTYFNWDSEVGPLQAQEKIHELKRELEEKQGGIIVLHDGVIRLFPVPEADYYQDDKAANRSWVPEALKALIAYFKEKNYSFFFSPDWKDDAQRSAARPSEWVF